jgi:hypothetical protein
MTSLGKGAQPMLHAILMRPVLFGGLFLLFFGILAAKIHFEPRYQAEAVLALEIKAGATSVEDLWLLSDQVERVLRKHIHLLQSRERVLSMARELNLFPSPGNAKSVDRTVLDLQRNHLVVSSPVFTNLIQIKTEYRDPQTAARMANTLAADYLRWWERANEAEVDKVLAHLRVEIARHRQAWAAADTARRTTRDAQAKARLALEAQIHQQAYLSLAQEEEHALLRKTGQAPEGLTLLTEAVPPARTHGTLMRLAKAAVAAAFFSLAFSLAVVWWQRRRG